MDINMIKELTQLFALLGSAGSIFYLFLIKLGFPKTKDGDRVSKVLTFLIVLLVYFAFNTLDKLTHSKVIDYSVCIAVILLLPLIIAKIFSKSLKIINKYSYKFNGFVHQEVTSLQSFQKDEIGGIMHSKFIIIFDFNDNFIGAGYLLDVPDSDDIVQQVSTYGEYEEYTISEAEKLNHESKYRINNKIIYDLNHRLKIFCLNMDDPIT